MTQGLVTTRQQQLRMVDQRVRLTTEILSNIRSLKLYAYETYFGNRILDCREKELARVRKRLRIRASMQMVTVRNLAISLPPQPYPTLYRRLSQNWLPSYPL